MTGLSLWWAKNKGWCLPLLLLALVGLVLIPYFSQRRTQTKAGKQVNQTLTTNAARKEADEKQQRHADRVQDTLAGQLKEQARATKKSRIKYEKATTSIPDITELPRNPPRYRAGGR